MQLPPSITTWPMAYARNVQLVGIVNTSPDSYFKHSVANNVENAVAMVRRHISEGAHLVEVGGLSGGSSAKRISTAEEIERTIPCIKAISEEFPQVTIIVDTFRSEVAQAAFEVGALWINDVTALSYDERLMEFAAAKKATVVIGHLEGPGGAFGRKLNRPIYDNVVREVRDYLSLRVSCLEAAGLPKENIIVDVNFGAGKRPAHDYELLASVQVFNELGCRQMAGCSRKQLVEAVSAVGPDERLGGSIMAAMWCAISGCSFLRVHEVRPYAQALDVWNSIVAVRARQAHEK